MWGRGEEASAGRVEWVGKSVRRDLRKKSSSKIGRKFYRVVGFGHGGNDHKTGGRTGRSRVTDAEIIFGRGLTG